MRKRRGGGGRAEGGGGRAGGGGGRAGGRGLCLLPFDQKSVQGAMIALIQETLK